MGSKKSPVRSGGNSDESLVTLSPEVTQERVLKEVNQIAKEIPGHVQVSAY